MATYTIDDLLKRWDRGEMTEERALGHVLQHLEELTQRVADLEKLLRGLGHLPPVEPNA